MKNSILPSATLMLLILFTLCTKNSFAEPSRTINLLSPAATKGTSSSQALQNPAEPYITRVGQVTLQTAALFSQPPTSGNRVANVNSLSQSELIISFFSDKEFRILVNSESSPLNTLLTIGGRESTSEIATFSMTVTEENFLINYQDLESGMAYKVKGKTSTGLGDVTEIDLTKMPPSYDLPPVAE